MKVCVLHNEYESKYPSGETEAVLREIGLLSNEGIENFYLRKSTDDFQSSTKFRKVIYLFRHVLLGYPHLLKSERIQISDSDVLHIHNTFPFLGFRIIRWAKRRDKKVILTIHNARLTCLNGTHFRSSKSCFKCSESNSFLPGIFFGCYRKSRVQSFLFSRYMSKFIESFANVDLFFVLNGHTRQTLIRLGVNESKIRLMPNPVDGPIIVSPTKELNVLFAGRLTRDKGLLLLIEAFKSSMISNLGWKLHIAGSGDLLTELEMHTQKDPMIIVHGYVSQEALSQLIEESCVVCVPSISFEGFPTMITKAASHGRGVLISDVGPLSELREFGWVRAYRPNVEDWANGFRDLADSKFCVTPNLEARSWWESNSSTSAIKQRMIENLKLLN
jgi:glycosyltransferase involved in cell wall biosynthesis